MMKMWKRYLFVLAVTSVLTMIFTFLIYKHVKLKFRNSHRHPSSADLSDGLSFNTNPEAKFYDLYDKSPLYDILSTLDRRKINTRDFNKFLDRSDVTELHRRHNLNVGLSDLLPLNRPVPDSRPDG